MRSFTRRRAAIISDSAAHLSGQAIHTVRILITAQDRIRQRIRSVLRVALATIFFAISGIISLGANVTTAFAKKVSSESGNLHHRLRTRRIHFKALSHHPFHHNRSKSGSLARAAGSQLRGIASWYGNEFHNRTTASGVRFDTHAMMAAHRTLPFGTKVLVTNLANKKSCIVEITDRGPFSRGRIIDLSYAAAQQIGMTEEGIASVKLEVLGMTEPNRSEDITFDDKPMIFDRIADGQSSEISSLAADAMVP